jgi:hypothetical protein
MQLYYALIEIVLTVEVAKPAVSCAVVSRLYLLLCANFVDSRLHRHIYVVF